MVAQARYRPSTAVRRAAPRAPGRWRRRRTVTEAAAPLPAGRSVQVAARPASRWTIALATAAWGALATLAACGGTAEAFTQPAPAAPASHGEVGLVPGETMSFEVRLGGISVGEAALAVGARGELRGHHAITVRSKIGTTGAVRLVRPVDDEATTVIDLDTGAPLQLDTHVLMGGQETFTKASFADGNAVVELRRIGGATQTFQFAFGGLPTYDAHSAMADLRGWRPQVGAKRTAWLVGGRRLWRVDMTYHGLDSVGTAQGNREAARLDGIAYRANPDHSLDESRPPRRFSVWISADADRVPLRVTATTELGEIEITLADYQRP